MCFGQGCPAEAPVPFLGEGSARETERERKRASVEIERYCRKSRSDQLQKKTEFLVTLA